MTTEVIGPRDRGLRQEDLPIIPMSLFQDNHSLLADERRARWNAVRIQGKLVGFVRCSDARMRTVGDSISIGNISAASLPSPQVASDRGLESLVAMSHIDGDTIEPGIMPTGCGGLAAKAEIGNAPRDEGIGRYVSETIVSKDPVIQAIVTAENLAYASGGKPVLAATQDHLDYTIYPIAFFQVAGGQLMSITSVRNEDILRHNPERIYQNGIPTISEASLPPELAEILEKNRKETEEIFAKYPDLKRLQKVQNPRTLLLSTDIRSARVRYPTISSIPGSIFKVHIPREKIGDGLTIKQEDLVDALRQLEYPIGENAVPNYGDPTKPFSNTDRVVFETGDIELTRALAREALRRTWMREWVRLPDRRIIIVQTNAGISNVVEELDPAA